MTDNKNSLKQMAYIARKRKAGYCSSCANKSEKFRCAECAVKHADRMRAYWAKTHGKLVEPIKRREVDFNEAV